MKNYRNIPDLMECIRCGLVRKSTTLENIKKYYAEHEEYEADLESSTKKEHRMHEVSRRISFLQSWVSQSQGGSLLEIGSHEGLFLEAAKRVGFSVVGIEPNEKAVAQARAMNLEIFSGTLEEFTTDKRFDVVALFHVLEHFEDPAKALVKINTLLKPGGTLIIEVPNIESFPARKKGVGWEYITTEHLSYFSPTTLRQTLLKTGFTVKKILHKDFDEWHVGIKDNLTRLGLMPMVAHESREIPQEKSTVPHADLIHKNDSFFRSAIRGMLVLVIKLLRRQNFILVVAKKI